MLVPKFQLWVMFALFRGKSVNCSRSLSDSSLYPHGTSGRAGKVGRVASYHPRNVAFEMNLWLGNNI